MTFEFLKKTGRAIALASALVAVVSLGAPTAAEAFHGGGGGGFHGGGGGGWHGGGGGWHGGGFGGGFGASPFYYDYGYSNCGYPYYGYYGYCY